MHFVTAALDGGPLIVQARVPILPGDDADTLAARVLEQEHRILPRAIRWIAEGRLHIDGEGVLLDGEEKGDEEKGDRSIYRVLPLGEHDK